VSTPGIERVESLPARCYVRPRGQVNCRGGAGIANLEEGTWLRQSLRNAIS
jgi:hypothetical protein